MKRVLFVCMGNICRSPAGEAVMQRFAEEFGVDVDVDGILVVDTTTAVTVPSNGVLVNNGDGTFLYTPNTDFNGTDSFTYTIEDDEGAVGPESQKIKDARAVAAGRTSAQCRPPSRTRSW